MACLWIKLQKQMYVYMHAQGDTCSGGDDWRLWRLKPTLTTLELHAVATGGGCEVITGLGEIIFGDLMKNFLCRVADRVLVLRPGVRPEPLGWERRVQDIGPPETSRLHVISIGESSPRDLHLNAKTQLHPKVSRLQHSSAPCQTTSKIGTQPLPLAERLPKIILNSQTPQNTPPDAALPTRKTRSSLIHQSTGTSPLHQEAYTTH